ncbi:lipopolysaccharide assembly protein LapB [Acidobacterium sp. S8]|uniref:tetratricopeptide repeat protein n=1 Tax=Acidobacterium sp. S8 TaxID=1641854 RepID=UPI00131BD243|nr:hypothetical protein [Acidobacterium sp. S8]
MKKVVVASVLAVATGAAFCLPAALALDDGQTQGAQSGQITIKDPAEYNAYTNAVGQSSPAAKAQAVEQFLQQYPNSVVKEEMLEQLMAAYEQAGQGDKELDAANRLLQVNPNSLRALTIVVYMEQKDPSKLDDASAKAKQALAAPKPPALSDADYQKLKAATTPIFEGAIAADANSKKDYKAAIDAYTAELKAYTDPTQTQSGPGLLATYNLGNAYVQQDPKDLVNGVWFLTRAAQFAPAGYKDQIEKAAEYWYKKYHCATTNATCMANPDGYSDIQQLAKANLFPPDSYKPVAAPPPPSPQDLAHQAVTSTPDLKTLALADKEFILANGTPEDAGKVWDVLKDVTAEVPGTVVSATADSVQLAVSDDAKQSQKADFTINMKTPLKDIPTAGTNATYVGTFDSYTQNPAMIILKDGEAPAKKTPAKRPATTTHHHTQG